MTLTDTAAGRTKRPWRSCLLHAAHIHTCHKHAHSHTCHKTLPAQNCTLTVFYATDVKLRVETGSRAPKLSRERKETMLYNLSDTVTVLLSLRRSGIPIISIISITVYRIVNGKNRKEKHANVLTSKRAFWSDFTEISV
jgi:hypothetical protein